MVDLRLVRRTRSAFRSWLPTRIATLVCLCIRFSCKACPGNGRQHDKLFGRCGLQLLQCFSSCLCRNADHRQRCPTPWCPPTTLKLKSEGDIEEHKADTLEQAMQIVPPPAMLVLHPMVPSDNLEAEERRRHRRAQGRHSGARHADRPVVRTVGEPGGREHLSSGCGRGSKLMSAHASLTPHFRSGTTGHGHLESFCPLRLPDDLPDN